MLTCLTIRNVVLIDHLVIDFRSGLSTLTGETGAGKSILLDAIGLIMGARANIALIRKGEEQASVIAEFDIPSHHVIWKILSEQDITSESQELILRRIISDNGKSRAFINDEPVSAALLKKIGVLLIEIHGQFDTSLLLDPMRHRGLLDSFGHLVPLVDEVKSVFKNWQNAKNSYQDALDSLEQDKTDEEYLRHLITELEALDPQEKEEETLQKKRQFLMSHEKLVSALQKTQNLIYGSAQGEDKSVENKIAQAQNAIERVASMSSGSFDGLVASLERVSVELMEVESELESLSSDLSENDNSALNDIETRLFDLKDCARKHQCQVDALPDMWTTLAKRLAMIDNAGHHLEALKIQAQKSQDEYYEKAKRLSMARLEKSEKLNHLVGAELPPLKLENATFKVQMEQMEECDWKSHGIDRIEFIIQTNPGSSFGSLAKVASGGELSRIALALKAVLAQKNTIPTLIFDEVDSGIGGATADAVGERLERLANTYQVLAVTHSPQVAARAEHHWIVSKSGNAVVTTTTVAQLDKNERLEELARMLSGAEITKEARAAAEKLISIQKNKAA